MANARTVFLVDDDELVVRTLARSLSALGYALCGHACDARAAVPAILAARPDIVLLDISLAGGTNGIDVAGELRAVADIPIVFLTGHTDDHTTQRIGQVEPFGYLVKPVRSELLKLTLDVAVLRRESEARLRASELRYRGLFEEAIEGIIRTTTDGTIAAANRAFAAIVGVADAGELVGQSLLALCIHADEREQLRSEIAAPAAGRLELAWRRPSGEAIAVELYGRTIVDDRRATVYQGFVRDVTEIRERAARYARLLERKEELELLIENARLGFWDWNLESGTLQFNDRVAALLGYEPGELPGDATAWRRLVHPEDLAGWEAAVAMHLSGARPDYDHVQRLRHRDGHWLWIHDRGKVFEHDERGRPARFCGTYSDITAEKTAEHAAIEASFAKTRLLANMSHELRTPLNAVLGLSEALLERAYGELTPKQERSLCTINQSGRHLVALVNDILDLARVELGRFSLEHSEINLDELIENSVAILDEMTTAKRQRVTCTFDPAAARISADPRRVKQVLINLLSNASKFTAELGTIEVTTSAAVHDGIEIAVTDSGLGIAAGDHARIFEPFVMLDASLTRDQRGAGLGLALVKSIVELHGGSVRVESAIGRGSTFVVSLPRAAQGGDAARPGRARPQEVA